MADNTSIPTGRVMNSQPQSLFFGLLPTEIRQKTYSFVFLQTRLSFIHQWEPLRPGITRTRPTPNSLALLRVCRKMSHDIEKRWMDDVLFHYGSAREMLHHLSRLPDDTLSRIRHLRVCDLSTDFAHGPPIVIQGVGHLQERVSVNNIPAALKSLVGLKLKRLTVLGNWDYIGQHKMIESLIVEGNGWREFKYIGPSPSAHELPRYCPEFNESRWQSLLDKRDGPSPERFVLVAAAERSGPVPYIRKCLRKWGETEREKAFTRPITPRNIRTGELLVIVIRGKKEYHQQKKVPLEQTTVVHDWRARKGFWPGDGEPYIVSNTHTDQYGYRDDYNWSHLPKCEDPFN
ncbi:hypothetical protein F4777DRAFT_153000 [Nemania sp. FL0916]|nr:hypothetical protein F4777DRAFT_153000 [Nemania sp. FL0916]